MSVVINTNVNALNAQRNLGNTAAAFSKSVEKLSSGLRINRAADDAAGLGISETFRSQVNGLNQAVRNAQDGISLVQTGEGALNEVSSMLQRIRELAVQYNNGTNDVNAQLSISAEATALQATITSIGTNTKFNGVSLLAAGSITLQVGANATETQVVTTTALNTTGAVVTDIASVDTAIKAVSTQRAAFGAAQNALEHTVNNLTVSAENFTAAESRIRDLDVASEMVKFTKTQILQQAGTSILAQANSSPQSILTLLR
ncbi:MAG TPA: flagellin [Candidatus Limnocylindrales bacterium]